MNNRDYWFGVNVVIFTCLFFSFFGKLSYVYFLGFGIFYNLINLISVIIERFRK